MEKHVYIHGAARGSSRFAKKAWHVKVKPHLATVEAELKNIAGTIGKIAEDKKKALETGKDPKEAVDRLFAAYDLSKKRILNALELGLNAATEAQKHSKVPMSNFLGYNVLAHPPTVPAWPEAA